MDDKKTIAQLEGEGDEFSLNGEMYDIIEKKIVNGKLVIRCISDRKETAMIKKYQKLNKENNSKSKSALLLKLVSGSYLAATNSEFIMEYTISPSKIYFHAQIISSQASDVLTPPPQFL